MKIKSCEIKSFGKLKSRKIELCDGINVIRGKNESGKSTLSVFTKYVLYGFSGRGRDERSNEKIKYTPWSGEKCSGALVLCDDNGGEYRVERSTDSKGSKCRIFDKNGNICYEGSEAGEVFFGTDSSGFSKSAFVGQEDIQPGDMKDIGASLEKLLLKSDADDTDFDKAVKVLNSDKNKLCNKTGTGGRMVELSKEIAQRKAKREQQSENNRLLNSYMFAADETEKNLQKNREQLEYLYAERENIEAVKAVELLAKISTAKENYTKSEREYTELTESFKVNGFLPDRRYTDELARLHSELTAVAPQYLSAKREYGQAEKKIDFIKLSMHDGNKFGEEIEYDRDCVLSVREKAKELSAKMSRLKALALVFLCLVVTIPVSVIFFVLCSKKKKQLCELLEAYGFSSLQELSEFALKYVSLFDALSESRTEEKKRKEVFEEVKIKCAACEELLYAKLLKISYVGSREEMGEKLSQIGEELIPDLRAKTDKAEKIYAEYLKEKNAYDAYISVSSVEVLRETALKKKEQKPRMTAQEAERAIKYNETAGAMLSKRLGEYKTEIARLEATVEDPAETENEIYALEEEYSKAVLDYEALELAIKLMESARDEIRGDVFPEISRNAASLFSDFTGGKYRGLFFDKNFELKVLERNDTETKSSGYLSSGTADAAYIALRVALADKICTNKPPLVFDDSFAKIDSDRLENILNSLAGLSEKYQIIILTCHDREEKILGDRCRLCVLDEA